MKETFQFKDVMPYQLRKQTDFQIPSTQSVVNGTKSIKFLEPKIWKISPLKIKQLENLIEFKKAIKQKKQTSCPFRSCKTYIDRLIWYRVQHICFSFYHYLLVSNYFFHFCLRIKKK